MSYLMGNYLEFKNQFNISPSISTYIVGVEDNEI